MRYLPFLGFVTNDEDPDLLEFLELDPERKWNIFIFEWLSFTYAFFAYARKVDG